MNIIVTTAAGEFFTFEVSADLEVETLIGLVGVETGQPTPRIQLSLNGIPLIDKKKTLSQYNVKTGDMLLMTTSAAQPSAAVRPAAGRTGTGIDWSSIQVPGAATRAPPPPAVDESERIRQQLLADPYQMSILRERDPTLASATSDKDEFKKLFDERQELIRKRKREEEMLLSGNPMDPEYQKKLYEMLQGKQIEENLEHAMEEHPESFGQVIMLYIDCEVNGHKVKAFVDSGAQMTLISSDCAERCNVSRLIDKRFQGIAKGVGTQKILGRVHLLPLKIGTDHFPCTFSVLENQPMDMLLGLDMLKRHQCIIDLKDNCLRIGTTTTSAPFLAEKDLPKQDTDQQPSTSEQQSSGEPSSDGASEKVKQLLDMGFSEAQASKALMMCNDDVQLAASLLYDQNGQL